MLRGRKLLLADDSLAIQKVIELTFEDEGMEVVCVGNGQLALERLEEAQPDILLIDVVMPGLSGYEVCERIRQHERFHHVPVILLVGSFEPFNEAEARRVGADDYLTKPFQSIRQMVSKVGSLLTGRRSEEDAATQRLPTPPELEGRDKGPASADNLEFMTADTAPLPQHLAAENQDESSRQHKRPFADLQLDDEMIEETPASQPGLTNQTAALPSHQRPTEPLRPREMAEAGISPSASATTGQQMTSTGTDAPVVEMREVAGSADAPPSTTARNAAMTTAATDDRLLDLDDVEMPRTSAMAEADDFILDLQDAAEAQPRGAASSEAAPFSFAGAQPTAQVDELEIEAEVTEEPSSASQGAEFTEEQIESVEQHGGFAIVSTPQTPATDFRGSTQEGASSSSPVAPQVAPETESESDSSQMRDTHELRSEQQQQVAPTEQLREVFQANETPADADADNAAAPVVSSAGQGPQSQPGQIGVEQLSPEAIDAIARRVVEQLSTKVIEQIAWEVVPQLSELLIKRRLEEGKQ